MYGHINKITVTGGNPPAPGIYTAEFITGESNKAAHLEFLAKQLAAGHQHGGRKFRFDDGNSIRQFDRNNIESVLIEFST